MSASCPRLGFFARMVLHPETQPVDVIRLRDSFKALAARRGLTFHIGGTMRHWMNLVWRDGSQAEHADREAFESWADAHDEVMQVEIGPLGDLDEG